MNRSDTFLVRRIVFPLTLLLLTVFVASCGSSTGSGGTGGSGGTDVEDVALGTIEDVTSSWSEMINSANPEGGEAIAASNNRVALMGYTIPQTNPNSSGDPEFDGLVAVYDADGRSRWEATIQPTVTYTWFPDVYIEGGVFGADDTLYIVGSTEHSLEFVDRFLDFAGFVQAYDDDGNLLWTETLDTRDANTTTEEDFANAIALRNDGAELVVLGYTEGGMGGESELDDTSLTPSDRDTSDVFVRVMDASDGSHVWTTQFGSAVEDVASPGSLGVLSDGRVVAAWRSFNPMAGYFLTFLSEDGNVLATIDIEEATGLKDDVSRGFLSYGQDLAIGADDSIYYLMRSFGTLGNSGYDVTLIKFDADGELGWIRHMGSALSDDGFGVAVDPVSGTIHVAGGVLGELVRAPEGNNFDAFVMSYDAQGTAVTTTQFGTAANDWANVAFMPSGARILAGGTDGTLFGNTATDSVDLWVLREE